MRISLSRTRASLSNHRCRDIALPQEADPRIDLGIITHLHGELLRLRDERGQ
jgi:hypothetical protein